MENSDGRLAPVTYLFGATPPAELPTMRSVFGDDVDTASPSTIETVVSRLADQEISERAALRQVEEPESDLESDDEDPIDEAPRSKASRVENVSMHALARKGMSRRELERTLRSREFDDESIAAELDRLEGVGLIDDMALAQHLVATLQERKGLGRSAIAAEMTRRLLAPAAIEYALDLVDTGDELARAREIAVKRASQLRSYDRETAVRRLSAYLARRGYSGSTVRSAVDAALPPTGSTGGPRFR